MSPDDRADLAAIQRLIGEFLLDPIGQGVGFGGRSGVFYPDRVYAGKTEDKIIQPLHSPGARALPSQRINLAVFQAKTRIHLQNRAQEGAGRSDPPSPLEVI